MSTEPSLVAVRATRRTLRGTVTRIISVVQDLNADCPEITLLSHFETLTKRGEELSKTDGILLEALSVSLAESPNIEAQLDAEVEKGLEYQEKIESVLVDLRLRLDRIRKTSPANSTSDRVSNTDASESSVPSNNSSVVHHINPFSGYNLQPEIFDGTDDLLYPQWRDEFSCLIDRNESLTTMQKFSLLRRSVKGQALEIISGILATEENYAHALKALDDIFGDKQLLMCQFVQRLTDLKPVASTGSESYASLVTSFDRTHRELKNLIASMTSGDLISFFLAPNLLSKLPDAVKLRWLSSRHEVTERYDIEKLLEFLRIDLFDRKTSSRLRGKRAASPPPRREQSRAPRHAATNALVVQSRPSNSHFRKAQTPNGQFRENRDPPASPAGQSGQRLAPTGQKPFSQCDSGCPEGHPLAHCPRFLELPVKQRRDAVMRFRRCFNCLSHAHVAKACNSSWSCRSCGNKHHSSLCERIMPPAGSGVLTFHEGPRPAGATAMLVSEHGSSSTPGPLTDKRVVLQLVSVPLSDPNSGKTIQAIALLDGGASQSWIRNSVAEKLSLPTVGRGMTSMQTFSDSVDMRVKQVTASLRTDSGQSLTFEPWCSPRLNWKLSQVDPHPLPSHLSHLSDLHLYDGRMKSVDIVFGADFIHQILTGRSVPGEPVAIETAFGWCLSGPCPMLKSPPVTSSFLSTSEVTQLWDLDQLGIKENPMAVEAPPVPAKIGDRYEMKLPFIDSQRPRPNHVSANKRLKSMTDRQSDADAVLYNAKMTDMESEGIIEKIPSVPNEGFFLPHRGIKQKGKIRIVFDGSSPGPGGTSLNDCLTTGENLMMLIPDVLIRFRLLPHPVVGDIVHAFHTVSVHPDDRKWLKFIHNGQDYQFARVPFGLRSSPWMLMSVLHHLFAEKGGSLETKLKQSFYVDDVCSSFNSPDEAQQFMAEVTAILSDAGMELKKPSEGPVLGLSWNRENDSLSVPLHPPIFQSHWTKRKLLSAFASIFDPLGLLSPYTLTAKIIFQKTWKLNLSWDDPLPSELQSEAETWTSQFAPLSFPRWTDTLENDSIELHMFTDASSVGYGCVGYLVVPERRVSSLVMAKSRVLPAKGQITIPRAELLALTIGVRLAAHLVENTLSPSRVVFHSDSTTAIGWLSSSLPRQTPVFVKNRVAEIRRIGATLPVAEVRHVEGELNPADATSRGVSPQILSADLWQKGPPFLSQLKTRTKSPAVPPVSLVASSALFMAPDSPLTSLMETERFSRAKTATRVLAWVLRFVRNLRAVPKKRTKGALKTAEIEAAFDSMLKREQEKAFPLEMKALREGQPIPRQSRLIRLRPVLRDGMICISSRSNDSYPALLPHRSNFTHLLIREKHEDAFHSGHATTLALIRRQFWLIDGVSSVKKVTSRCTACRRFKSAPFRAAEGSLPAHRNHPRRPFSVLSLDHAGPILDSSGKKMYILVVCCLVTRAVRIEATMKTTAESTHHLLRRILSDHMPAGGRVTIFSDNARGFVLSSKIPFPLYEVFWRLIPPRSPTWGGCHEAFVKLTKNLLRVTFHGRALDRETLISTCHEMANCLNSRPMWPISASPQDEDPIVPGDFLFGVPPPLSAELSVPHERFEKLWTRWTDTYIASLKPWRSKPTPSNEPSVGDVVLVRESSPRGKWPLGRIQKLFRGNDGIVRAVALRIRNCDTRRDVRLLYPLEKVPVNSPKEKSIVEIPKLITRSGRESRRPDRFAP